MKKTILVAVTPETDERLKRILHGHDLRFTRTLADAQRLIEADGFDLVVIGVHFDDSRMFDLLRHVRAQGRHADRPVVCVRIHEFISPAISLQGLEIAAAALRCDLFLDLTLHADDEARKRIEQLLG